MLKNRQTDKTDRETDTYRQAVGRTDRQIIQTDRQKVK